MSAIPNFLNLALCDYCHKNATLKPFQGKQGMQYALDLNGGSGYGLVYVENTENEFQIKFRTEVETYSGFSLPPSVENWEEITLNPH